MSQTKSEYFGFPAGNQEEFSVNTPRPIVRAKSSLTQKLGWSGIFVFPSELEFKFSDTESKRKKGLSNLVLVVVLISKAYF